MFFFSLSSSLSNSGYRILSIQFKSQTHKSLLNILYSLTLQIQSITKPYLFFLLNITYFSTHLFSSNTLSSITFPLV